MDDLANPLPAIVTAEMLGVPTADHAAAQELVARTSPRCSATSSTTPAGRKRVLQSVEEMAAYFHAAVSREASRARPTA